MNVEKRKAQGCFRAGEPRPWRYKGGRKEAQRRYREAHAEEIRERKKVDYQRHKEAHRERSRQWRKDNPDKWKALMRNSNKRMAEKLRAKMIDAYGQKCTCCGENEVLFLELDHINNDGAEDRKKNGTGVKLLLRLEKRGWPKKDYQLLCSNCNQGKRRNNGICPHKKNR